LFCQKELQLALPSRKRFVFNHYSKACKKLTKMQRKVFDSGKQRSQNSDIPYKAIKQAAQEREKVE
jgi:hypothetical protein